MQIGVAVLLYKAMNRKSTPRWRGPAKISDVSETVKFQSQTFKEARHCARQNAEEKDVEGAESNPLQARTRHMELVPWRISTL